MTELLDGVPVGLRGYVDTLALDGLDNEGGDIAGFSSASTRRRRRREPRRIPGGTVRNPCGTPPRRRQRTVGEAVEAVFAVQHPRTAGRPPGELQSPTRSPRPRSSRRRPVPCQGGSASALRSASTPASSGASICTRLARSASIASLTACLMPGGCGRGRTPRIPTASRGSDGPRRRPNRNSRSPGARCAVLRRRPRARCRGPGDLRPTG